MTSIKVNNVLYPASINGRLSDTLWDGRETKTITLELDYEAVFALLPDNTPWAIVVTTVEPVIDPETGLPTGETTTTFTEYDNSEFCLSGDITDHRDGTCSIKMGKPTELEEAYEMLFGGDDNE